MIPNFMAKKLIIKFDEYLDTVEKLALVINQKYKPTVLVGIMRIGGEIVCSVGFGFVGLWTRGIGIWGFIKIGVVMVICCKKGGVSVPLSPL